MNPNVPFDVLIIGGQLIDDTGSNYTQLSYSLDMLLANHIGIRQIVLYYLRDCPVDLEDMLRRYTQSFKYKYGISLYFIDVYSYHDIDFEHFYADYLDGKDAFIALYPSSTSMELRNIIDNAPSLIPYREVTI